MGEVSVSLAMAYGYLGALGQKLREARWLDFVEAPPADVVAAQQAVDDRICAVSTVAQTLVDRDERRRAALKARDAAREEVAALQLRADSGIALDLEVQRLEAQRYEVERCDIEIQFMDRDIRELQDRLAAAMAPLPGLQRMVNHRVYALMVERDRATLGDVSAQLVAYLQAARPLCERIHQRSGLVARATHLFGDYGLREQLASMPEALISPLGEVARLGWDRNAWEAARREVEKAAISR